MKKKGFSWEKRENLLGAMAQAGGPISGLVFLSIILRAAVDYINLPKFIGRFLLFQTVLFLLWLAVSVTKIWWTRKDLIIPFISDFIGQAIAGKKGNTPAFGTLDNDPIATKSIPNLLMADFFIVTAPIFGFGSVLHAIGNISEGKGIFGAIILLAGCLMGLMFLFIAIQINSKVIFYHKPDYIFKLLHFYRFWKLVLYCVLMTLIIGFGAVFLILGRSGQGC
jgi:hypothetical protein